METVIILGLLAISSGIGGCIFFKRHLSDRLRNLLFSIGAGAMLSVALTHVFPESLELSSNSSYAFLIGFLLIYLLEEFLTPQHTHEHCESHHHDESPKTHLKHIGLIGFWAISAHTIFDGVLLASVSESGHLDTIFATLFGVIAHQIPVSFALASLLKSSQISPRKQYYYFILFILSPFLGYFLTLLGLHEIKSEQIIALLSALSAGSLLYIATADLLPYIHRTSGKYQKEQIAIFIFTATVVALFSVFEHNDYHN